MRFIGFEIENFKGIGKTALDFSKIPHANVFTLVGLNESGKTTILEAINSFSPVQEGVESLYSDVFKAIHPQDLVPKVRKGNFSGKISVRALLAIDKDDKKRIGQFCRETLKCEIDPSKIQDTVQIERELDFKDSNHRGTEILWDFDVRLKKGKNGTFKDYKSTTKEWLAVTGFVEQLIPQICYFPTFLFAFPEKIYLSNPPKDSPVNAYYVQIIQDILDSVGGNLNIQTHILDRVEKTAEPNSVWNWFGFLKTDEKQQVDHVMLQIAEQVTDVVFSRWNEVFGVKLQNKTIDLEWAVEVSPSDPNKRSVYLKFRIRDGRAMFNIAERSLGFRWFFCFLLLTQFRASRRDSSAVFLFDEPASNLHSKAQEQLLKSFSNISKGNNAIIYSTHSHYMIEPRWLEGSFIVFNDAIDYDEEPGNEGRRQTETNIHVKKYRDFVGQNPSKITYFQPILDKLDYAPAKLELGLEAVFVEGKNDFYMLAYFNEIVFKGANQLKIVPSSGANDLGPLISLYLGWGKNFLVLLDDDKAGRSARDRYREEWMLSNADVVTIADAAPTLTGKAIEKMLSENALKIIAANFGKQVATKKDIGRFFQEMYAQEKLVNFDPETLATMRTLLSYCGKKLK